MKNRKLLSRMFLFLSIVLIYTVFCAPQCPETCTTNQDCSALLYCAKQESDCSGTGICAARPDACIELIDTVCGCDGATYDNECYAEMEGVNIASHGECCSASTEPVEIHNVAIGYTITELEVRGSGFNCTPEDNSVFVDHSEDRSSVLMGHRTLLVVAAVTDFPIGDEVHVKVCADFGNCDEGTFDLVSVP